MNMLNGFAYCKVLFDQEQAQDFIYLEVNDAFEKLTGFKDVVGKKVTEIIPGIREADPELFETYGRVALTGKPETFEIYLASLGAWHSVSLYSPRKEYFVAVFDVITERKRAEEALRESEERYRDLVQHSHDLICTHDLDGNLLSVNSAATEISGYTEEELLTMNMRDLLAPEARGLFEAYRTEIQTQGSARGLLLAQTKSGARCILEYDNSLRTEGVAVPIVRGMARDITERKRAEEEIKKQLDELQRWHKATLGRETRILDLKREVNELLGKAGQPPRYPSAET
jgi:PAS domain S-box-containing protein